jgi:hypothetical protein
MLKSSEKWLGINVPGMTGMGVSHYIDSLTPHLYIGWISKTSLHGIVENPEYTMKSIYGV